MTTKKLAPKGTPPWRVGRKVGRTIYDADDNLIGVMDEQRLAVLAVTCFNMCVRKHREHMENDRRKKRGRK